MTKAIDMQTLSPRLHIYSKSKNVARWHFAYGPRNFYYLFRNYRWLFKIYTGKQIQLLWAEWIAATSNCFEIYSDLFRSYEWLYLKTT